MATPLLQARGIKRRFGHVRALDWADFSVYSGEICALVGDNGAGKSTLVKILSGADRPDEGQILLGGQPVAFDSPTAAQAKGIATVYQDLALAAELTPTENLDVADAKKAGVRRISRFRDSPCPRPHLQLYRADHARRGEIADQTHDERPAATAFAFCLFAPSCNHS
jgi:ABC-type sugar transport system ATPase subunit